jgi:hypothetical protein
MKLGRENVAGAAFVLMAALIVSVSGDLPFGTLASRGAGMMPKLVIGLMLAFGLLLLARAGRSPALAAVAWGNFPQRASRSCHHGGVCGSLHLAGLSCQHVAAPVRIDIRGRAQRALFSAGVTGLAYVLFRMALKSPLPQGLFAF